MREEAAFVCDARSAGVARSWVNTVLDGWAVPAVDELAVLLVSEVVTNALLHAQTDVRLVLDLREDDRLVVEAWDTGVGRPEMQRPRPWDESGRGLCLVDELATRWGWTFAHGAKCVWFEVRTGTPDPGAAATGAARRGALIDQQAVRG